MSDTLTRALARLRAAASEGPPYNRAGVGVMLVRLADAERILRETQESAPAPVDEGAWLIETAALRNQDVIVPHWWTGLYPNSVSWTTDANRAVRFARKQDAEAVIHGMGDVFERPFATEHVWADLHPAPAVTDEREREIREAIKDHTPGPWTIDEEGTGDVEHDGVVVAHVMGPDDFDLDGCDDAEALRRELWANAQLVAAAPTLSAALDAARAERDAKEREAQAWAEAGSDMRVLCDKTEAELARLRESQGRLAGTCTRSRQRLPGRR